MKRLCVALFVTLLATPQSVLAAPAGSVAGTVCSVRDGRGIPSAIVSISSPEFSARTITDESGRYRLAALPPGHYTLSADANGYTFTAIADLTVTAGAWRRVDVTLQPARL